MSCGPTPVCQSSSAHLERTTPEPAAPVLGHDSRLLLPGPPSYSRLYAVASATLPRAVALTTAPAPSPSPPVTHVGSLPHAPSVFLTTATAHKWPRPSPPHPGHVVCSPPPRSICNRFSRVKQSRVIYQRLSGPSEGREWPGPEMAPTSSVDKVSEFSSDEC